MILRLFVIFVVVVVLYHRKKGIKTGGDMKIQRGWLYTNVNSSRSEKERAIISIVVDVMLNDVAAFYTIPFDFWVLVWHLFCEMRVSNKTRR